MDAKIALPLRMGSVSGFTCQIGVSTASTSALLTSETGRLPMCRRHHRAVHEGGFRVALGPAGDVHFVRPDGRSLEEVPPLAPMVAKLERARIRLGPQTGTPAWRGERLDVDWAVSVLWRRRPQAAPDAGPPA